PALGQDFDASVQSLEWAVSAYALAFAVLLLAGRTLGDRFGQRRIFLLGLTIFTAASAACALAPNVELFDVALAAQGGGRGVIRGSDVGWTSKQVLPALGAGVLWLGAFAAWQLASPAPVLPFRVRRPRQFAAVNVVSLVVFFGVFGSTFLLMQFLQLVQGD